MCERNGSWLCLCVFTEKSAIRRVKLNRHRGGLQDEEYKELHPGCRNQSVTIADVRCDVCWRCLVFGTGGSGLPAGRAARIYSNPHRKRPATEQHDKWKTK